MLLKNAVFVILILVCYPVSFTLIDTNNNVGYLFFVLASGSHYKESNLSSIRTVVMDEEDMRPGHCLQSVHCVPFDTVY